MSKEDAAKLDAKAQELADQLEREGKLKDAQDLRDAIDEEQRRDQANGR
jgi:hypothetical protein